MTDNLKGIGAIVISGSAFVLHDTATKLITNALPAGQLLFLRGIVSSLLLLMIAHLSGQMRPHRFVLGRMLLLRALCAAGAALFIVISLRHLPLATVYAVIQIAPLMVVAGAGLIFGERLGRWKWFAALIGFTGALLILNPWRDGADVPTAFAAGTITAALLSTAARELLTRGIPAGTPPLFIAYATSLIVTGVSLLLGLTEPWLWPSPREAILIATAGLCITIAYAFGVIAMRSGEMSVVAPFRYVQIPLAVALGWLVWSHVPDAFGSLGIAMILTAGYAVISDERRRTAQPAAPKAPRPANPGAQS
jgi:drug/metabolite transporter (DMT)-like permease